MKRLFTLLLAFVVATGVICAQDSGGQGFIDFSFDQVDVAAFVKLVGGITGKKFVVSDSVTGKVTIVSPRVSPDEVYPLFVSILESCGCSVVQEGEIYRVVSLPERKSPIGDVVGVNEETPSEGIITKVLHLEHVSAGELRKILEASVGGGRDGAIGAIDETNHLVITDTADNIKRIEKIVSEVDKPGLTKTTDVIFLKYANASDLANQLNSALYEGQTRGQQLQTRLPRANRGNNKGANYSSTSQRSMRSTSVVANPHSNSLMLIGSASQNAELKRIIQKMDVDSPSGRGHLNAIFLKYIEAEQAAESLSDLLTQLDKKVPYGQKRRIAIAASVENNAIIVDAMPGDYEMVRKLVEQLDRVPEQVHITVLIAETTVGEGFDYGLELAAFDQPDALGGEVVQGGLRLSDGVDSILNSIQSGIFPGGLSAGIAYGNRADADGNITASYPGLLNLNAIKKDSNFNVLSEASLEAQNNKEASVMVVDEIPITASTISGTGDSRDIIQDIERIEVGIKLQLTPHIIPGGEVQMILNPSIEAVIDQGPDGSQFAPTIARRQVSTTVTVPNGKTIVIAGLTRTDKTKVVRKIPILGSIPLLGWLFRSEAMDEKKVNLMIFVTPRIVSDIEDAQEIMASWEKKTGISSDENRSNDK
ncbi:type II secretion system protein GspD [bacterium E08(2017)]|nr:type II secretion system protein GspD [bacterium E08(2017)]